MEQEANRWLLTQLGYNTSADTGLAANCRGNLKGLWEFIISNYKTADSKRHIQHVLAKHRREQEAARRAPEQHREAQERRQRLRQLQKKRAELEQTLASFQARTEVQVQETTDQANEQSMLQHVLQETQAKTLLLQAFVRRGQQLLPELQGRLSQLRSTLDSIKARCRSTGGTRALQAMQQHLAALTNSIKEGLHQAVRDTADNGIQLAVTDLQQQQDQHQYQLCRAGSDLQLQLDSSTGAVSSSSTGMLAQQQGTTTADSLQQLLQLCKLLHSYRVPPGVFTSALQLLQTPPSALMEACAQLAQQNLLELTARLDEAEREMLAPLHWHAGTSSSGGGLDQKQRPDQQLVSYSSSSSSSSSSSKHKLPWASGLGAGMSDTAALEQQLPPEVRIKKRLRDHMQLHVHTEQALQRARATQQDLDAALGSTPLLQAVLSAAAGEDGAAGTGVSWEAQLAQVYLTFVKVRAQVELLQQFEQQFSRELEELQEIKAVTEEKQLLVRQQMQDDHELNQLLHLAAADTVELEAALHSHQQRVLQVLNMHLLPCSSAAAEAAQAAVGQQKREVGVVEKLPLLDLTEPVLVTEAHTAQAGVAGTVGSGTCATQSNPVLTRGTLSRMQAAGRQLVLTGRATTGGKPLQGPAAGSIAPLVLAGHEMPSGAGASSSRKYGDNAAVAALQGAMLLDPLAPVRCPAVLMLDISGQCAEARQLQQQLEALSATGMTVTAHINHATHEEDQLQEKVSALRRHDREELLPKLHALLEEGQAARAFAREQLMADYRQLWDMPAMHLVPHRTHQGKNCSQWLLEIQQLHAQKRELSSHAAHMA